MRLVLLVALLGACDKDSGSAPAGGASAKPIAGAPSEARASLMSAWKTGGLKPSAFAPTKVPFGSTCESGTVDFVEVVICEYPDAKQATAAEAAALTWVGATTGLARAKGTLVIAAADRRKADPHGKTLNALVKLAP